MSKPYKYATLKRQAYEYFDSCKIVPDSEDIVNFIADEIEEQTGYFLEEYQYTEIENYVTGKGNYAS